MLVILLTSTISCYSYSQEAKSYSALASRINVALARGNEAAELLLQYKTLLSYQDSIIFIHKKVIANDSTALYNANKAYSITTTQLQGERVRVTNLTIDNANLRGLNSKLDTKLKRSRRNGRITTFVGIGIGTFLGAKYL